MQHERAPGLDFLRALAAFFVVAIHLFPLCAGVNREPTVSSPLPDLFFYALVLCGVNCFGLISGYVGYREKDEGVRISSLLLIWFQMVFYRVLLLWLPWKLGVSGLPVSLSEVLLPLTRRVNWYITAYFEMMLLAPLIQRAVRNGSRRENARMMLALFVFASLFTLIKGFVNSDPFLLDDGYSWMWLGVLYFWGCSLKKHGWFHGTPSRRLWAVLALSLLLTALWRALASAGLFPGTVLNQRGRLFYPYTSPTLVLASGCMLLLAARFKPSRRLQGMLRGAAAASLGVFLIHTTVWYWLIEPRLAALPPTRFGSLRVFLTALLIALPCALIDLGRGRLFAALRIKRLTDVVQTRLLAVLERVSLRMFP